MKILLILPRIPAPPNDGGAIYVYHITKHMALRGHNLVMASFESNRHEQKPKMLAPYCRIYSLPIHFKPYNVPSVLKSTFTRQPITVQHRMDVDLMNKIISEIPDQSFDLISIEGIHSAQFIDIVKKKYPNTPVILRQANVEHLLIERNAQKTKNLAIRWFLKDQARLMKKYEIQSMQMVDGVTAVSSFDMEKFLELIPGLPNEVITDGADLPEMQNIQRDTNTLLAISNWAWRPNIEGLKWFIQKVWPKLRSTYPELIFEIAGHGIPKRLQKEFIRLGITYLGFVDDIEECRQKATMMVVPLLSGSGVKLKILEGLASGVPVITTAVGAEGIDIHPGKEYLHAETPDEFIKQIGRLLNDPELRRELSKNGRRLIEQKYQWDEHAERLEKFMNRIIEMNRS